MCTHILVYSTNQYMKYYYTSCKTIHTPITCRTLVCVIVVLNLNHFLVCLYKICINNYNILSSTAQNGTSPLYIASQNGHTQIVELLLRKGADPNLTYTVCGLVWSLYLLHVLLTLLF